MKGAGTEEKEKKQNSHMDLPMGGAKKGVSEKSKNTWGEQREEAEGKREKKQQGRK